MMEGVQRVAGVAQAGGEGFALAGDGVRVDFSTGLRGGIGDSGNETADDGGGNDGQDGAGRGKGGAGNEEVLLRQGWCRGRGRGGGRVAVEAIGLRGTWGEDYMVPLLYSMGGRDYTVYLGLIPRLRA